MYNIIGFFILNFKIKFNKKLTLSFAFTLCSVSATGRCFRVGTSSCVSNTTPAVRDCLLKSASHKGVQIIEPLLQKLGPTAASLESRP